MPPASPRQPDSIPGSVAEVTGRQRAIRDYTAEPVTDADLAALLDAACHTGTERNRQRWALIVITDPGQRRRLAAHGDHARPLQAAPLVLALVQEADGYEFDTGRIAQNIMITATALGLATCPVTLHRDHDARHLLGLRDDQRCATPSPSATPTPPHAQPGSAHAGHAGNSSTTTATAASRPPRHPANPASPTEGNDNFPIPPDRHPNRPDDGKPAHRRHLRRIRTGVSA